MININIFILNPLLLLKLIKNCYTLYYIFLLIYIPNRSVAFSRHIFESIFKYISIYILCMCIASNFLCSFLQLHVHNHNIMNNVYHATIVIYTYCQLATSLWMCLFPFVSICIVTIMLIVCIIPCMCGTYTFMQVMLDRIVLNIIYAHIAFAALLVFLKNFCNTRCLLIYYHVDCV